jgi:hypothetical protein
MIALASQVADYLSQYRRGDRDAAFFGLLETDHAVLPELMAAYRSESDSRVRAFLVEVIWQHRQQSAIPFLGEALHDSEAVVWQQALDGLVTLASPAALEVLCSASQSGADEFRGWLAEAIEQAEQPGERA